MIACTTQARTFTDSQGRELEAEIIAYDGGDAVTIRRSDGNEFPLNLDRLSAADQAYVRNWKPKEAPTVPPEKIKRINELFGAELFVDGVLWDDAPSDVAKRLSWPEESQTATQSSFRKYNRADDLLFGARPYSSTLYGQDGKVDMISIIFANKGDSAKNAFAMNSKQIESAIAKAIDSDGETITKQLSTLGEPEQQTTATGRNMKERLKVWDWNGHTIMLAVQNEEYVAVRIMPPELAANRGRPERVSSSELKVTAKANVQKRANGDVIITNIPMVDQGPKGYCVPATLERALRYMGIRADMYLLAMAGNTSIGGGTYVHELIDGAEGYVKSAGRKLEGVSIKLKARNVAKYIDQGQPILWTMFSTPEYNALANSYTQARAKYPKAKDWEEALKDKLKDKPSLEPNMEMGHACMIIGYNEETDEIAVSDSWGPAFTERWVPASLANDISQGKFWVVDF
ncbi:C39 family peptidase [Cerasicoccus arenae]|uniref:Peptidase C39-like domain-containing protein n=2 Tax=Cerasicoccus arenae TaxID=424488 RepID=A0A8J3GBD0_9BACT|nr:C39 family peptidase [Cerasicoccus arenae]GHB90001.1 hypothetical protein GCM10007047_00740 [Cerasicoccus arenae]